MEGRHLANANKLKKERDYKKMKKLISVLLMLTMFGGLLTGCASTQSTKKSKDIKADTNSSADTKGDTYTIGYNYFTSSSYALLVLANNSLEVINTFGNEPVGIDDEVSVEKIVQDVENMISSGVDGLILWLPTDSLYLTVSQMCEEAKIPFVLNDKIPTDPKIVEELKANPYFAGAISPANAIYGENVADYALSKGWKTCLISSSAIGDPSDQPRLDAFIKKYKAGGGTILDEMHANSAEEAQPQIDDSLVANPNPDFIFGVGSDFGLAAVNALANKGYDTKVVTCGLDKGILSHLGQGTLEMVTGDFWISGTFSAVILQNYLDGTPLKDKNGDMVWIDNVLPFQVSTEEYDLFKKCFIDESCYSTEELRQMSGKVNPAFNYNTFLSVVNSYSLEDRLKAKYNEGKITADELAAAGIN